MDGDKISENEINRAIIIAKQKIIKDTNNLRRFINYLEPHLAPDCLKSIESIYVQYNNFLEKRIPQESLKLIRISIANTLISSGTIDILASILVQLLDAILCLKATQKIDDQLYEPVIKILDIFTKYSDISIVFGVELCKRDNLLSIFHRILVSVQEACVLGSIDYTFIVIVVYVIGTLFNTLLYDSEDNLEKIRNMKFVDIMKDFLKCNIDKIKIMALLFTAYAANECDSVVFKSDQGSITYLLNLFIESIQVESGIAQGFSVEELAKGIEKLSKNDENKQLLVDLGLLPILKRLMKKNSLKHKEISLSILWSLSFDERNRKVISENFLTILGEMKLELNQTNEEVHIAEPPATGPLQDAKNSLKEKRKATDVYKKMVKTKENVNDVILSSTVSRGPQVDRDPTSLRNEDIKIIDTSLEKFKCSQVLDGLLWTLQESEKKTSTVEVKSQCSTSEKDKKDEHIMISYCWSNAEVVMNIYEALKDQGYKLWIDKYNMAEKDNLMESMALAVENSSALIICVSNSYKESINCRAEAQYAVTKKKPLFPVMVQQKFRPDGWLGFCISGLLYCDFKGSRPFDVALKELTKHLRRIDNPVEIKAVEGEVVEYVIPVTTSTESTTPTNVSEVLNWSNTQILQWFEEIGIKKVSWKSHYSGLELSFLKNVLDTSMKTFFQLCFTDLTLTDLQDLRIFVENIKNL